MTAPAPSPGSGWLTIQANPAVGSWPSAREAESFPPAFGEWWYREAKAQRTAREQAERRAYDLHLAHVDATNRAIDAESRLTAAAALVEEAMGLLDAYTENAYWSDEAVALRARAAALFGEKGDQGEG